MNKLTRRKNSDCFFYPIWSTCNYLWLNKNEKSFMCIFMHK